jgi:hypothetical protein
LTILKPNTSAIPTLGAQARRVLRDRDGAGVTVSVRNALGSLP